MNQNAARTAIPVSMVRAEKDVRNEVAIIMPGRKTKAMRLSARGQRRKGGKESDFFALFLPRRPCGITHLLIFNH